MYVHPKIQNALISVFDKTNLNTLAQALNKNKIQIFSTQNTENALKNNNIPVKNISDITQYPEMLNGQIKTIHPKIFAGILGNYNEHLAYFEKKNIILFDLVIVNFYLFNNVNYNEDLEHLIDIGGPALVRAAAKNYKNTTVITNISDYAKIIKEINAYGNTKNTTRLKLAQKAFEYTNNYDYLIFEYFNNKINNKKEKNKFPKTIYIKYNKKETLKYGENPHQKAALYIHNNKQSTGSIDSIKKIHGKQLSYNNIYDAHIAYECANQFQTPTCVIVKHGNPCSASSNEDIKQAYLNAYTSDPISAFGGIIGINQAINTSLLITILKKQFVEIIIGPAITKNANNILNMYPKLKVLICGYKKNKNIQDIEIKTIRNSLLVQEIDNEIYNTDNWTIVTEKKPNKLETQYALFAWKIIKFIKSNAILYSNKFTTIGIGSGQTNRLASVKLANSQYNKNKDIFQLNTQNIIVTSDAFFPFRDSIDTCTAGKNVSCIIQPGGSIRDPEVIQAANERNICMIFTNQRNFKH